MSRSDHTRIREMLATASEAIDIAGGRSASDLAADRMRFLATVRLIEIVGEASATVSAGFKESNPDIPWREMADTRNRLIHGYYDVDPEIVARIVDRNLPPLVGSLRHVLDHNWIGPNDAGYACPDWSVSQTLVKAAVTQLHLSTCAFHPILKSALTMTDVAGTEVIGAAHVAETRFT